MCAVEFYGSKNIHMNNRALGFLLEVCTVQSLLLLVVLTLWPVVVCPSVKHDKLLVHSEHLAFKIDSALFSCSPTNLRSAT